MPRSLLGWDEFLGTELGKADYFYWILLLHSCGWGDSCTPPLCYGTAVLDVSSHTGFVLNKWRWFCSLYTDVLKEFSYPMSIWLKTTWVYTEIFRKTKTFTKWAWVVKRSCLQKILCCLLTVVKTVCLQYLISYTRTRKVWESAGPWWNGGCHWESGQGLWIPNGWKTCVFHLYEMNSRKIQFS